MDNILVKRIILHVLDSSIQMPVLSEVEHPLHDEIVEFIEKHMDKVLRSENLKNASFLVEDNPVKERCEELFYHPDKFTDITKDIAALLFNVMIENVEIPPADVAFVLVDLDNTPHLAIMKFNYRYSYIHHVQRTEGGNLNEIIKQKTALPAENQKMDECAVINLVDSSIQVLEKKVEWNGEKIYYFSSVFLKCTTQMSFYEKKKAFDKTTETFSKKYFEDDFIKSAEIKKAVHDSIQEKENIDIVSVADNVFHHNPELRNEYIEEIEKAGLVDKKIAVEDAKTEKKFTRQKIKTDNGIEINLPIEYYGNKDNVEFITNPDGTISIILKNISRIM